MRSWKNGPQRLLIKHRPAQRTRSEREIETLRVADQNMRNGKSWNRDVFLLLVGVTVMATHFDYFSQRQYRVTGATLGVCKRKTASTMGNVCVG